MIIEKIQLYIPSLLDLLEESHFPIEQVEIIGMKNPNIKFFIRHPIKETVLMKQIVTDEFALYDIHLDLPSKTLSFVLESDDTIMDSDILQKAFQTFAFKYNSQKFGFFMDYSGRDKKRFHN